MLSRVELKSPAVSGQGTPPLHPTAGSTEGAKKKLVILGNGMVGQRFCTQIADLGLARTFDVTVVAEEPCAAYDRVHLAKVVRGASAESLQLTTKAWFEQVGIRLRLDEPALSLDRTRRQLTTPGGVLNYDVLVLATGSAPAVPRVDGLDSPEICVYRTLDDALRLKKSAARCSEERSRVVVLGAGLLGVEAAESMLSLGCEVTLLEAAPHLLPRQLNSVAAERLAAVLTEARFDVRVGSRLESVEKTGPGYLLHLAGGVELEAGCLIVAAGVRPRDEIARESGLDCDLFGGIIIDDSLASSDPNIFAIGECARHRGYTYGMVAPGYAMADVLAARLAERGGRFDGAAVTTRLKIKNVDLTCVGESNVRDLSTRSVTHEVDGHLRQLVLRRKRIVGATSIGTWADLPKVQQAISIGQRVSRRNLLHFERTGQVWPGQRVNLALWSDRATVCGCTGTTCGSLRAAQKSGATTPEGLRDATGAGSVCGSCEPLLRALCGVPTEVPPTSNRLLVLSALALSVCIIALAAPGVPYAKSVLLEAPWERIWRESLLKQISGFTLLGVALLAASLSLRKRIKGFRVGEFSSWRTVHAGVGLACLLALAAHTGFRLGDNLDAVLGISFLIMTLVGSVAGISTVVERKLSSALGVTLRIWSGRLHLWTLWPLPVLVGFHVFKVYFF